MFSARATHFGERMCARDECEIFESIDIQQNKYDYPQLVCDYKL